MRCKECGVICEEETCATCLHIHQEEINSFEFDWSYEEDNHIPSDDELTIEEMNLHDGHYGEFA